MQFKLRKLSNADLDQNLKSLAQREREVLSEILLHIVEVDIRKLYLKYAYPNLFAYLTEHIGYSAGSAQRRIDAARLSVDVPEIFQKIEKGQISLAHISRIQKSIRQAITEHKTKISKTVKADLVNQITEKSSQESEIVIKQILNIEPKSSPHISYQKDETVRLEVTLSKHQWNKLIKMRELLSHSVPHGDWDQILEYVSDKIIQQKDKSRLTDSRTIQVDGQLNNRARTKVSSMSASHNLRQYIPRATRRHTFHKDQYCQYTDKITGKKCTATWQLTLDHIRPVWAGGTDSPENLRVLCANHNRQKYFDETQTRRLV